MKNKVLTLAMVTVLVIGFVLASGKTPVFAGTVPVPLTGAPAWQIGTAGAIVKEIAMDKVTPLIPGLQLMSPALVTNGPVKVCYDFRGGQFGWNGQIRMLVGGEWVSLATTQVWTPDKEGKMMACAEAPAAGTFALFAYWKP